MRDSIVSVLMSPDFLYRFDLSKTGRSAKAGLAKAAPASGKRLRQPSRCRPTAWPAG